MPWAQRSQAPRALSIVAVLIAHLEPSSESPCSLETKCSNLALCGEGAACGCMSMRTTGGHAGVRCRVEGCGVVRSRPWLLGLRGGAEWAGGGGNGDENARAMWSMSMDAADEALQPPVSSFRASYASPARRNDGDRFRASPTRWKGFMIQGFDWNSDCRT